MMNVFKISISKTPNSSHVLKYKSLNLLSFFSFKPEPSLEKQYNWLLLALK